MGEEEVEGVKRLNDEGLRAEVELLQEERERRVEREERLGVKIGRVEVGNEEERGGDCDLE